jgi:hypothetical protein
MALNVESVSIQSRPVRIVSTSSRVMESLRGSGFPGTSPGKRPVMGVSTPPMSSWSMEIPTSVETKLFVTEYSSCFRIAE